MPDRMGPLRTTTGRFVERVNGGRISEGGVVARGDDLGVEGLTLPFLEGAPTVPGSQVGVLAPAGIRAGDGIGAGELMAVVEGIDEATVGGGTAFAAPLEDVLAPSGWLVGDGEPFDRSSPLLDGASPKIDESSPLLDKASPLLDRSSPMLCSLGELSPDEVFGLPAEDLPGEPVGSGETFTGNNPFLAVPVPGDLTGQSPFEMEASRLLDAGVAAPLDGASFGLDVLATPNASVAGQSANPMVGTETVELLHRPEARRMLRRAGVTDADEVEWLAGPRAFGDGEGKTFVSGGQVPTTFVGTETGLEHFVGVVSGNDGPWGVGVHVARVTDDDHVLAAGVHRVPVGTPDGGFMEFDHTVRMRRGSRLTVETIARLERG